MRYGCVSPTPEMEDVDHSDAESSDASFEIVSAEGIEDSQTLPPSFKPCIKFHDIFDVYPMDADVVARVSTSGDFKMSSDDKVVVVPLAWSSVDQAVCVSKLNGFYVRFDVNELPKAPVDQFYQLCYCTAEGSVVGVSAPFFFREVHEEDLMEFQKEQNKEFWTFRSRFAVLTDLYWNAVKNNGTTRPDEMSRSFSSQKASETTEKSSVESSSANKDAETTDESSSGTSSSIQVSETPEESAAENCSASKAAEMTDEPSAQNGSANDVSGTPEKSPAENSCVTKDSEFADETSTESKKEDPVQPPAACVNQEPTIDDQKIDSSEKEQKNIAEPTESKPVSEPTDNSALNCDAPRKCHDDRAKRFINVGPWELVVNDSFYNRKLGKQYLPMEQMGRGAPVDYCTRNMRAPTLETKMDDLRLWNYENAPHRPHHWRYGYNAYRGMALMQLMGFRALPESIVGRLVLDAMHNMTVEQLDRDQLLCEARRQTRYDELMRRNGGNLRPHATNHPKEPAASHTIFYLTSKIENQAILMQDLKMQLANESKTIETLKKEYLTYKKDMETRLKHCAKIYAKMSLKLRQLSSGGRNQT